MRIRAACLITLISAGCATAPSEPARTSVHFTQSVADTEAILISRCATIGAQVTNQTTNTLTCQKEMSGANAVLAGALIGNAYSTTPVAALTFVVTPTPSGGSTVQWNEVVKTQYATGQWREVPMNNAKENNNIAKGLVALGGQ